MNCILCASLNIIDGNLLGNSNNYSVFRTDRVGSRGSGVCILCNYKPNVTVSAIRVAVPDRFADIELCAVTHGAFICNSIDVSC